MNIKSYLASFCGVILSVTVANAGQIDSNASANLASKKLNSTQSINQVGAQFSQDNTGQVIYEMNVYNFTSGHTFQDALNATNQLQDLEDLGVNYIWLMPIMPNTGSPYAVKDFYSISPLIDGGDSNQLNNFISVAHSHHIKVILDWPSDGCAKTGDNCQASLTPPKNAGLPSVPNDLKTKSSHFTDVTGLDYSGQNVQSAMSNAIAYWAKNYDIDGFRMDFAEYQLGSGFWNKAITQARAAAANRTLFFLAEGEPSSLYTAGFDLTYANKMVNAYGGPVVGSLVDAIHQNSPTLLVNAFNDPLYSLSSKSNPKMYFTTDHDIYANAAGHSPYLIFDKNKNAVAMAAVISMFISPDYMILNGQEYGMGEDDGSNYGWSYMYSNNPNTVQNYWLAHADAKNRWRTFYKNLFKALHDMHNNLGLTPSSAVTPGSNSLTITKSNGAVKYTLTVNFSSYYAKITGSDGEILVDSNGVNSTV
jgi:glycosidase